MGILVQAHRQRVRFLPEAASGMATPVTPSFPYSGNKTPPEAFALPPTITVTEAQFR